MTGLGCLWYRPRLERHVDGVLGAWVARSLDTHVQHCEPCRGEIEQLRRLRALVHEAAPAGVEPDWSGFWPAIQGRILTEPPRPFREPWWLPLWKPLWGHPRLAATTAGIAALAVTLTFNPWPGGDNNVPAAWAAPVVVQDVTMELDRSVMVYSSPDHGLTVIWVFSPDAADEPS